MDDPLAGAGGFVDRIGGGDGGSGRVDYQRKASAAGAGNGPTWSPSPSHTTGGSVGSVPSPSASSGVQATRPRVCSCGYPGWLASRIGVAGVVAV
ncbi:hypothetical protein [Actinokineospora sp. HUAS TT18]|uniref:hypothetical protein n=1 Tax=Actinokineospora sp. HUAS TT18 TaxID=3447451 RepID=UPI003F523C93